MITLNWVLGNGGVAAALPLLPMTFLGSLIFPPEGKKKDPKNSNNWRLSDPGRLDGREEGEERGGVRGGGIPLIHFNSMSIQSAIYVFPFQFGMSENTKIHPFLPPPPNLTPSPPPRATKIAQRRFYFRPISRRKIAGTNWYFQWASVKHFAA